MMLKEVIPLLQKIKDKYYQYRIECFIVKEWHMYADRECDVQEKLYNIDFTNRIVYIK